MGQSSHLRLGSGLIGLALLAGLAGCTAVPQAPGPPAPGTGPTAAARSAQAPTAGGAAPASPDLAQSVFFAPDTADLTPDARRELAGWAAVLRSNPGQPVTIVGHGDPRSTRDYSIALGAKRAEAVKVYLVALGVPAERLATTSLGMERPTALGSSAEADALDRRAVLVFESLAAASPP